MFEVPSQGVGKCVVRQGRCTQPAQDSDRVQQFFELLIVVPRRPGRMLGVKIVDCLVDALVESREVSVVHASDSSRSAARNAISALR